MRATFDEDADAVFLYLMDGAGTPGGNRIARTEICDVDFDEGAVILLLDGDGRLVGFEILGASHLLGAEALAEMPRARATKEDGPG